MEFKVNSINTIDQTKKSESKNEKVNDGTSFSAILNKCAENKKEEHTELDFNSSSIKQLERIFKIDIKANKDKLVKDNGKINLSEIIHTYGNNPSGNDLRDFQKNVTALWENGEIDNDDYYYALKWINEKILEKSKKLEVDDLEYKELDKITSKTKDKY